MRVPHLVWVHTLIAPPLRPKTFRIPPYEGLAAWESGTTWGRGNNLTSLTAGYPEMACEREPGAIAMMVFENGHYYQVRIIPHPQKSHWSLEAVDSMLPAITALPDPPAPPPCSQASPRTPCRPSCRGRPALGTQTMPSTASGGGRNAAGHTPGRGQRRGGSTSPVGSSWKPSRNGRQRPTLRPTCAPSSRSTRSGRWHWASNCNRPSALRQTPRRHTRPLCTKS